MSDNTQNIPFFRGVKRWNVSNLRNTEGNDEMYSLLKIMEERKLEFEWSMLTVHDQKHCGEKEKNTIHYVK